MRDGYLARSQPPAQACPGVWVRHPTVADLVALEAQQGKPDLVGWYLVRFMVTPEGAPIWAEDELDKAERVHAAIANAVIEKVGQLLSAPPDCGQAGGARSGLEVRDAAVDGRVAAGDRPCGNEASAA